MFFVRFLSFLFVVITFSGCVTNNNLPSDCKGARAHTEECENLVRMVVYGKKAAQFADQKQYEPAIDYYKKAAQLALAFKPELYMEYKLNQVLYIREKSKDTNVVYGLKNALSVLQQVVPDLEKIKNAKTRAHFYNQLGATLSDLSDVEDDIKWAQGATSAFKAALDQIDQAEHPQLWANLHHSLGVSYSSLYYLDRDIANLTLAKMAFQEASQAYSQEKNLERWAMSINAIADIEAMQAIENMTEKQVKKATDAYLLVLDRLKDTDLYYTLATSLHNLGILVQEVGKAQKNIDFLNQSIGYFDKSMDFYNKSRDLMPWVSAQSHQARSMKLKAQLTGKKADFEEAVSLYRNAIETLPKDKAPIIWAKLHRQLGYVYSSYGEQLSDPNGFEYAIGLYEAALTVYQRADNKTEEDRLLRLIERSKLSMLELRAASTPKDP
ncbi:hypothetical protein [Terasakiella sp.]|uniref:hypothetical protein n=1 Tax=Terasakiella sp. TaxID=2034861 RepID=UPI003AA977FE